MGCSASKEEARKRAARESWYAPISRSISAPINYAVSSDDDSSHVVSLTSSSYGILKMERPGEQANRQSSVDDSHVKDEGLYSPGSFMFPRQSLMDGRHGKDEGNGTFKTASKRLNPVDELPELEGELEVINTWELMEGLEDGGKTPSPLKISPLRRRKNFEKSLSFSSVQELDSGFTELGSPVWRKYYLQNGMERHTVPEAFSQKGESPYGTGMNLEGGREKCPMRRSPCRVNGPGAFELKSPKISPLRSPQIGSSSPLFDPSLMATFEQAVAAVALPESHWTMQHANEGSISNSSSSSSSSSSDNHTWVLSETSSDAESPLPQQASTIREGKTKSPVNGLSRYVGQDKHQLKNLSFNLDNFELRCPPRGEQRVVLYFTSLRGIRKTYEACCDVRAILQGYGVHVDDRDVWMHSKFRDELTELLGNNRAHVPRLFIKGRYIGGADVVKQLHEDGTLIQLIEDLPTFGLFRKVCDGCADVRFIPCLTCSGSCKVLDEMDQVMRCSKCNENGLIMCPMCSS